MYHIKMDILDDLMNTIKEEWTRKWNNHSFDSTVAQYHPKNMTYEVVQQMCRMFNITLLFNTEASNSH